MRAIVPCLLACWGATGCAQGPTPIVFDSDRDGGSEIYVIGVGGSESRQITVFEHGVFSRLPDWSPDCARIAFQSNREDPENPDIYLMSADGSGARRLTKHPAPDESPAWSPDGSTIAFASDRGDGEAVWVIEVDGSGLRRVTSGTGPAFQPTWSPDGGHIAFISGSDDNWDLYVARADGSGARNLTNTPHRHEGGPAWSPDGRYIAFDALQDGHWEIYLMHADGSNERQVTRNSAMDARPAWSTDGSEFVFHSTRAFGSDGDIENWNEVELYVMEADGTNIRRLTNNEHFDAHPDWCSIP